MHRNSIPTTHSTHLASHQQTAATAPKDSTKFYGGLFKPGLDASTIKTISTLLANIVAQNASCAGAAPTPGDEIFASAWQYSWATVYEYVDRLKEWIVCGPESFVVALCLLKRLEAAQAIPPINQTSVHRLVFTTLVLAVKMTEDETLCNPDFAKVGCVSPRELFYMELHCLKSLNFSCFVSREEFIECCQELQQVEVQIQKKSQLPVLRHQPNPLTIRETIRQLSPQCSPPPVETGLTRRMSLFNLRRKTSRQSLMSPIGKTAESNSSKPDLSARRVAAPHPTPSTPKQTTHLSTTPKQSTTPKFSRTTALVVNTPKKATPSTTPKQVTAPRQILKSVSLFGINRRKQSVPDASVHQQQVQVQTPKAHVRTVLTPHRATPRLLLRQDSI